MNNYDERLYDHWRRFFRRFRAVPNQAELVFEELKAHYGEEHRTYHGTEHPVVLLDLLKEVRWTKTEWFWKSESFACAVEFALWGHDIFNDTTRQDNEERSAAWTLHAAQRLGFPGEVGQMAHEFVLATKHQVLPTELGAQIVVDIDLSPLAVPWPQFSKSSADIRRESPHKTDEEFRRGQRGFLEMLLARPSIYSTEYFRGRYEANARANIERALQEQYAPT
jgi:predicted metal-dependent HD superfamily phosphohydrolase